MHLCLQVLESFQRAYPGATAPSVAKLAELQEACRIRKEQFQEDEDLRAQTISIDAFCKSATGESISLNEVITRENYDKELSNLVKRCMDTLEKAFEVTEKATAADSGTGLDCPAFNRSKVDKVSNRLPRME
jgi:molecular chaperone DnaK (HSP70)